jgi:hypothetical protein
MCAVQIFALAYFSDPPFRCRSPTRPMRTPKGKYRLVLLSSLWHLTWISRSALHTLPRTPWSNSLTIVYVQDGGIPLVNFGPQGIMRCKRCRTYINPFVSWMNNGRQWRCNVCGMVNDVPTSYFCHLDSNGFRRDRDQRPELCNGSVELVAPAEYMVRPPVAPVYFFCIDISSNAVNSGMVLTAVKTIKSCLDE